MTTLLEVDCLVTGYVHPVLREVSFEVDAGQLAVLSGLNGSGRSTTVNAIAGLLAPWSGSIRLDGSDVGGLSPPELVRRGVALVPEGRRVFPRLTVDAHLRLGAWTRRRDRAAVAEARGRALDLFPRLAERLDQQAGTMSGGEQQMLAIARALLSQPRLLIVDEASLGLSPSMAATVYDALVGLAAAGTAVLVVEQQTALLALADQVVVLEKGAVVFTGSGDDARNADLQTRFLGAA